MAYDWQDDLNVALSAASASAFSTAALYPLDTVKTLIVASTNTKQTGDDSAPANTAKAVFLWILKTEGFLRLYRGLPAKMTQAVVQKFVYFYIYAALVKIYKRNGASLNIPMSLVIGYWSGVGNMSITMPVEVLATRLQTSSNLGLFSAASLIFKESGVVRLYRCMRLWINFSVEK